MRISFKRFVLFGGIAFVLFVGYMAYQLLTPAGPIAVSPQTTVITEPLADDGLPDYAAHLLSKMKEGVTPENNGAIPFLEAMWPAGIAPINQPVICSELGMELPTENGMTEPYSDQDLVDALVKWQHQHLVDDDEIDHAEHIERETRNWITEVLIDHCGSTPWTTEGAPQLAEWLNNHAEHFDKLQEAAAREKYYLPPAMLLTDPKTSLVYVLLPHVQTLRSAARCLALRAYHHIGEGDLPAAWQDARAIYRLSETPIHQALVGDMVSIACQGIADQIAIAILDSNDLSPELASEIWQFYRDRPPRDHVGVTIDEFERLAFVNSALELAGARQPTDPTAFGTGNTVTMVNPLFGALRRLAMDWELVLQIGNTWYDEVVAAMKLPSHAERQAAFDAIESKLAQQAKVTPGKVLGSAFSRTSRSKNVANVLSDLFLPAVVAAKGAEDRANALLQLQQVASALAVYRLEHGDYPNSLDTLVPAMIDVVPVDPYGNALKYKRATDGYLLYSFGKNGSVDDGGSQRVRTRSIQGLFEIGETAEGFADRCDP